jgi:hypothetical protein
MVAWCTMAAFGFQVACYTAGMKPRHADGLATDFRLGNYPGPLVEVLQIPPPSFRISPTS